MRRNQNDENMKTDCAMLTGMFRDRESSENVFKALQRKGYSKDEINLVMSDATCSKFFSDEIEKTEFGKKAINGLAGSGNTRVGINGALVGSGIPEARAKFYELGFISGHIVMGVQPRNEEDSRFFEDNWRKNKGVEIHN